MAQSTATFADEHISSPAPPRFRWPMRLFLSFVIFDMVFHSLASLTPYRDWLTEKEYFNLSRFPRRLPTLKEIGELEEKADPDNTVSDRIWKSFDSVWEFFKPWPDRDTRKKLKTWEDKGKFALCWVTSRLDFFESLAGIPQRWTMFSPNAAKGATVARSLLLFRDGTVKEIRLTADPADLTHYSHWFQEKVLDYELKVANDWDSRYGYCNYLAHQYKENANRSPLEKIFIYKIYYYYPRQPVVRRLMPPDEKAADVLRAQNGPPNWDRDGPDFVYDVETDDLSRLKEPRDRLHWQKQIERAKRQTSP
jgi:hypothetical protein